MRMMFNFLCSSCSSIRINSCHWHVSYHDHREANQQVAVDVEDEAAVAVVEVFNVVAAVVVVDFVVEMIEEAVVVAVSEVEVAAAVDFEVAADVETDDAKKKKKHSFPFCLLFAIFCMAFLIIVVFSIRYITQSKQHEIQQKK